MLVSADWLRYNAEAAWIVSVSVQSRQCILAVSRSRGVALLSPLVLSLSSRSEVLDTSHHRTTRVYDLSVILLCPATSTSVCLSPSQMLKCNIAFISSDWPLTAIHSISFLYVHNCSSFNVLQFAIDLNVTRRGFNFI